MSPRHPSADREDPVLEGEAEQVAYLERGKDKLRRAQVVLTAFAGGGDLLAARRQLREAGFACGLADALALWLWLGLPPRGRP